MADETKKSKTGLYVIAGLVFFGLVAGSIYLFSRSSKPSKSGSTTTTSTANTGLSGLLSGLNLSGLDLALFGA